MSSTGTNPDPDSDTGREFEEPDDEDLLETLTDGDDTVMYTAGDAGGCADGQWLSSEMTLSLEKWQ